MSTPTANPLGAGSDLVESDAGKPSITDRISNFLQTESQDQPEAEAATETANPEPDSEPVYDEKAGRYRDPKTNRFVKVAEPETGADEGPKPEGADVESDEDEADDAPTAEQSEPQADEYEELPDTIDGLAESLGLKADDLLDSLKVTVKVNGEERAVTLREAANGHQMEADYRNKTAALADERREIETLAREAKEQREHYASVLSPLVKQLEDDTANDNAWLQQVLSTHGYGAEYDQARTAVEQRRLQKETAQKEYAALQQQAELESQQSLQREVAKNNQLLVELMPELGRDHEKGRQRIAELRRYINGQGVPAEMADNLYDAYSFLIADKAKRWDDLQAKKGETLKEVKKVPKRVLKPGPSRPQEDPKLKVHRGNINRLRKTGDMKDFAAALRSGGIV